jgi:hypothetical protein
MARRQQIRVRVLSRLNAPLRDFDEKTVPPFRAICGFPRLPSPVPGETA